eukprot:754984-Hanusia_phi.AAC.6
MDCQLATRAFQKRIFYVIHVVQADAADTREDLRELVLDTFLLDHLSCPFAVGHPGDRRAARLVLRQQVELRVIVKVADRADTEDKVSLGSQVASLQWRFPRFLLRKFGQGLRHLHVGAAKSLHDF